MDRCAADCAKRFAESKAMKDRVAAQFDKKNLAKMQFKEFNREEFDKNFLYGYEPILKGMDYFECESKCFAPKQISGRASEIG